MRVRLLGTGSADGWPNPFCDCRSCAAERAAGRSRRPSAALVDDRILVDCGPTTPHLTGHVSLRDVEHLLVTHGHPDHLQPMMLLTRSWVDVGRRLHVWGPEQAIAACRAWVGPDADVDLHVVGPGTTVELPTAAGTYAATVLAAEHHHGDGDVLAQEAVLYAVTAPDGDRLLYATDTGALPASTIDAVGGRVDLVLIDETFGDRADHGRGHLDLTTLPGVLDALRAGGVVDVRTLVAATHLSHHNPPAEELRPRLRHLGVLLPDDGDLLDLAVPGGRPAERMLLLGGARSGKSTRAEAIASAYADVGYVATAGQRADDPEWAERVALHRARRPEHWATYEAGDGIDVADVVDVVSAAEAGTCVLVDCLTLWLTAVLDRADAWARAEAGDRVGVHADVDAAVDALVDAVRASRATVVLVSNEVGMGVVPASASGRLFADLLGRLNARVADACDTVTLMVAGRPLDLTPQPARRLAWSL